MESFEIGIERIIRYIKSVHWKNARSYAKYAPHEYTVREWNPDLDSEFVFFVEFIREHGYKEKFGSRYYTYLDIADFKYWTMGSPIPETVVINRTVIPEKRVTLDSFL
ncbi:MAG: hypothetical protein QM396_00745 [Euryarchaeota archaeon]|nr:hypothetical protein [Euryarchaeota archaeon]